MFNPQKPNQMNIKLVRTYRSKNGNPTFVYGVSGSQKDLAAFKAAQGEYYREDETGSPLWFTTRCVGTTGKLIITTNGNVVPDMSAFDQAASIAAQYGGNFGAELAKAAAGQILNLGASSSASSATPAPAEEEKAEDIGEL